MADEKEAPPAGAKKNNKLIMIIGGAAFLLLAGIGALVIGKTGNKQAAVENFVQFKMPEGMYQLKDGAYLSLGFNIVVSEHKLPMVSNLMAGEAGGSLQDGINMILGNKTREDLINGAHKREAFVQEIKKVVEERVFQDYNKGQKSPQDMIEVRKIFITKFVTQTG